MIETGSPADHLGRSIDQYNATLWKVSSVGGFQEWISSRWRDASSKSKNKGSFGPLHPVGGGFVAKLFQRSQFGEAHQAKPVPVR